MAKKQDLTTVQYKTIPDSWLQADPMLASPFAGQTPVEQQATLRRAYLNSPRGQSLQQHLTNIANQQKLNEFFQGKKIGPTKSNMKALNEAATTHVADLLNRMDYRGGTHQNNMNALLQQMQYGNQKGDQSKQAAKLTPEYGMAQLQKTPQYQTQQYYNQVLLPTVQGAAQRLNMAAQDLATYQHLSSKGKTAFLASKGYTSESDIYRGLQTYMPKDEPVTPDSLASSAVQVANNPDPYILTFLEQQATAAGKPKNTIAGLMKTMKGQMPPGLTPIQQIIYAMSQGGAIESASTIKELGGGGATGSVNFTNPGIP
jgi:uncharacterized protein YnzC (UPF0291/DUF896 family)